MRKCLLLIALVSMFLLTGCDFFRSLAGRPTSEEIEEMRVEKLRVEEERLQANIAKLEKGEIGYLIPDKRRGKISVFRLRNRIFGLFRAVGDAYTQIPSAP